MTKIFIAVIAAAFLVACNSSEKTKALEKATEDKTAQREKICTELYTGGFYKDTSTHEAAAVTRTLWPHTKNSQLVLKVSFMNGSDFQQNKVREYASVWSRVSESSWDGKKDKNKIQFNFVPYEPSGASAADIRIYFEDGGSSSYVGSECLDVPKNEPTMFFGWVNEQESEESIRQVILHEFGHALGLVHEHQHPEVSISWDSAKVYRYYHDTQKPPWTKEQVDFNIFYRYDKNTINYTRYDSTSIMHYAIPRFLTKNHKGTPWNPVLSKTDSGFIKTIYPYKPCIPGETCCYNKKGKPVPCP